MQLSPFNMPIELYIGKILMEIKQFSENLTYFKTNMRKLLQKLPFYKKSV